MSDYTHENLPLYGKHVPDYTVEPGPDGINRQVELPGKYQVFTEVGGVPVLLFERKAGKLLKRVEQAKQQAASQRQADESAELQRLQQQQQQSSQPPTSGE